MTKNNSNFLWALYNQSKIEYFWDVKCLGPCEAVTVCKAGYWLVDWQVLSTWNTSPQTSVLIRNFTNTGANLVISLTPLTSHLSPLTSLHNLVFSVPREPAPGDGAPVSLQAGRHRQHLLSLSQLLPCSKHILVHQWEQGRTPQFVSLLYGRIINQWHCHVS